MRKVIILFLLLTAVVTYSQEPPCQDIFLCNTPWTEVTFSTTVPGYNCTIEFNYKTRWCPNPLCQERPIVETYFVGMTWSGDEECDINYCIWPNYPNTTPTNWECVRMLHREGYRAYSRALFEQFYDTLPEFPPIYRAQFQCTGNPCDFPNDPCEGLTHRYIVPRCVSYSICGSETSPDLKVVQNYCRPAGTGCCIFQINHCYCVATNQIISYEIYDEWGDIECDPEMPLPPANCPEGFDLFFQSPCTPQCNW
jgi:hypothetical protein